MNAIEQLRALSAEQRTILRSKSVKLNRSPDDLLALLEPVAELSSAASAGRKKAGCWSAMVFAVAATLLLLSPFFAFDGSARTTILLVAAALVAGTAIFLIIRFVKPLSAANTRLSHNLTEVAIPFLRILREDVPSGSPMQIRMELDDLEREQHRLDGKDERQRTYLDPWFGGQATFADGTRLQWRVTDRLRVRTRTKRSASGKTKYKTKRAVRCDVAVKLAFPSNTYSLLPVTTASENPPSDAAPAAPAKRLTVSLKATKKTLRPPIDVLEMLVTLIADAYRGVSARKGA